MDSLKNWLLHSSLKLWLENGVDHHAGGFHEYLAPDTGTCDADFRRLRVAARQTYVFARAHEAGLPGADAAVSLGVEFLRRRAALPSGGYATRFDLAGRVTDASLDLYDNAFVLLALSAACRCLPRDRLRAEAVALLSFLQRDFAHPSGGYRESLPPALPRRQNPHMHLLEAVLAAHAAFADEVFLAAARGLVSLCLTRFIDPATGALLEFFDEDLARLPGDQVPQIEPGHACEWIWLFDLYQQAAGPDPSVAEAMQRLATIVDRHGQHPVTGDLIDALNTACVPLRVTARLWPQTERLKAAIVRADATQAGREHAAARLATWLRPDGLWVERRDEHGNDVPGPAPASSLYHLTCAILLPESA